MRGLLRGVPRIYLSVRGGINSKSGHRQRAAVFFNGDERLPPSRPATLPRSHLLIIRSVRVLKRANGFLGISVIRVEVQRRLKLLFPVF